MCEEVLWLADIALPYILNLYVDKYLSTNQNTKYKFGKERSVESDHQLGFGGKGRLKMMMASMM